MSDVDPDLPDYLIDAILSQGPPAEAVDLVKDAFTWRTIDAELMELSYDSVLDEVGVRDAGESRIVELQAAEVRISLEIDGRQVRGQLSPAQPGILTRHVGADTSEMPVGETGSFVLAVESGPLRLSFRLASGVYELPVVAVD